MQSANAARIVAGKRMLAARALAPRARPVVAAVKTTQKRGIQTAAQTDRVSSSHFVRVFPGRIFSKLFGGSIFSVTNELFVPLDKSYWDFLCRGCWGD